MMWTVNLVAIPQPCLKKMPVELDKIPKKEICYGKLAIFALILPSKDEVIAKD